MIKEGCNKKLPKHERIDFYRQRKRECDHLSRIGALLREKGPVNPVIQEITATIMIYYQNFGHARAFYDTVTTDPLIDDKLRQLVDVFGFHADGYAMAHRKLLALGGKPASEEREHVIYFEALTAFVRAWRNCKHYAYQ